MIYSAAFTSEINKELTEHLLRICGQEDLCFALWKPSTGSQRTTALICKVILPKKNERAVHGNASFHPKYFERALALAMEEKSGLAFLHSHIGPGWQGMSPDDVQAENTHAPATKAATGYPLVGLTLGTDGLWSARFWEKIGANKFERRWCRNVRIVGENGLDVAYADHLAPPPPPREQLKRTISAWGIKKQQDLSRLKIGVIGVGSVGSIVVEALSRMGIQNLLVIDFDKVEIHNLDRLLHATSANINQYKTEVITHGARKSATAEDFVMDQLVAGVTEKAGFNKAIDCDLLFSCVDRPWPRSVLNFIAYAHLIPVIDGGIKITKKHDEIRGADWKAHAVLPSRRCLECLEQFNPADVSLERSGKLDDPAYIESLDNDYALKANQNVFVFSSHLASMEVLQMLSLVIKPLGVSNPGEQNYHFTSGSMDVGLNEKCNTGCPYKNIIALGDHTGWNILSD